MSWTTSRFDGVVLLDQEKLRANNVPDKKLVPQILSTDPSLAYFKSEDNKLDKSNGVRIRIASLLASKNFKRRAEFDGNSILKTFCQKKNDLLDSSNIGRFYQNWWT